MSQAGQLRCRTCQRLESELLQVASDCVMAEWMLADTLIESDYVNTEATVQSLLRKQAELNQLLMEHRMLQHGDSR